MKNRGLRFAFAIRATIGSILALTSIGAEIPVADATEIAAAMKEAKPGDALVMSAGTWTNQDIVFTGEGLPDKPITLRAAAPGAVILDGASRLRIAGRHLVVDGLWFKDGQPTADIIEFRQSSKARAENCVLRNTAITGFNPLNNKTECRWVSLYGAHNVVESCYFADKRNAGATLVVWVDPARPNAHVIRRNHFGPRPSLGKNGGETIRIGDSATSAFDSRTLVEGNLFERCNGEVEIVSSKSCENVYRGNTFLACEGALTFRHGQRCTAEGNFFLGQKERRTGGIRIIDADHTVVNNYFADLTGEGTRSALTMMNGRDNSALNGYFQVRRATVAFNTFVNCRHNFLIGQPDEREALAPADCAIVNNLVVSSHGPLIKVVTAPQSFAWAGNIFFGAPAGIETEGITASDPQVKLGADGLWRPSPESPALRNAVAHPARPVQDMDGQPRPEKHATIGADEPGPAPKFYRPLQPEDVGPAWLRPEKRGTAP